MELRVQERHTNETPQKKTVVPPHSCQQRQSGKPRLLPSLGYNKAPQCPDSGGVRKSQTGAMDCPSNRDKPPLVPTHPTIHTASAELRHVSSSVLGNNSPWAFSYPYTEPSEQSLLATWVKG